MTHRRAALGLVLVLALAIARCEDVASPHTANLSLRLSNAGTSDRAMLVQIAGTDTSARIDTVLTPPGSSYRVFAQRQASAQWRVVVTGTFVDGVVVDIAVPDPSRTTAYSATILDVADASFAELQPGNRALSVTR